jgi:hypothetical protein
MVPKIWWERGMNKEGFDYDIDGTNFCFGLSILRGCVRTNVKTH